MATPERRRAVRAPARLAMQVKLSGGEQATVESINVSANGVYFTSDRHVPEETKVGITLVLPAVGDDGDREVEVEGIVVRCQPEKPDPAVSSYDVACYFTTISDEDERFLESYILRQLAF